MSVRDVTVGSNTFDTITNEAFDGDRSSTGTALLLHGFPQTKASWKPVLSLLDDTHVPAVAFDQRGYSSRARPATVEDYAVEHLITDVIGFCDALGLDQVDLVGHDWGAIVAWNVAARHSDRVRSLVAVSVPHPAAFAWAIDNDPDQSERSTYMELFRSDPAVADLLIADNGAALLAGFGDAVPAHLAEEHLDVLLQPGALDAAINWYRALSDLSDVAAVTVPTTLIWGTEDMAVGRAGVSRSGEYVDNDYRLRELEGVSHWVPEQAPDVIVDEVHRQRSHQQPAR